MVLPALALAYLWAGPPKLGKRVWQLLAGGGALLLTAGWWVAIVLFTPAADRPFAGSSTDNNILNLTFVYNGFGRLTGNEFGGGRGFGAAGRAPATGARFGGGAGSPFGGATGITRLFQAQYGGQVAWLIPAALIALVVMVWMSRRASRTDRTRAAALLWGAWLLVAGLVLSFMSGISHTYYTVALTPAIGALVGIGAAGLILAGPVLRAGTARGRAVLAAIPISLALIAGLGGPLAYSVDTAATSQAGASPSAGPTALSAFGGRAGRGGFPGRGGFGGAGFPGGGARGEGGLGGGEVGHGGFPGFAGGAAGGSAGHPRSETSRGFDGFGGQGAFGGSASVSAGLTRLLEAGAAGYKWVAATVGSDSAASLELSTGGDPVMAIGGFSGSDPAPTLAEFKKMVSSHQVPYFVAGGFGAGLGGRFGAGGLSSDAGRASANAGAAAHGGGSPSDSSQITSWVEAHFTAKTVGGETVYDLATPTAGS